MTLRNLPTCFPTSPPQYLSLGIMISSRFLPFLVSCSYAVVTLAATLPVARRDATSKRQDTNDATVLILGGGVSGIIAAKTLTEKGITNFKIIEARDELGGRLHSERFGEPGRQVTVEVLRIMPPPMSLR